ncbi:protein kinase [Streptomyces hainanensis]|uniref:Protein kinase n=1 Tax=Streptomyces hainanensis TaxID=402648 RepID=A0A4R4SME3_9ACTN|nr:protein kinase [Streptomyces hainanensis]TDC64881.1 protein kinase [Streptomyces hainanensis]
MPVDLTPEIEALIQPYTGKSKTIRPTSSRGYSSDITTLIEGEAGSFFIKAMRNQPGGGRDSLMREKAINPFVRSVSPPLLWTAENGEWIILGFQTLDCRSSSFAPGSSDLPTVVDLLNRVAGLSLPEVARGWVETRWDRFAPEEEGKLFRGDVLLHTDINGNNLVLGKQGSWIVDWAWPSRGAAFIDPATLVVQLVAAGHSPEAAESWATGCKAWVNADPQAIDAFAAAQVRMYWQFAFRRPEETWLRAVAEAAEAWANHRGVTVMPIR